MQFARSENDVLAGLLLECLHARVRLAQQLETANKLRHVRRVLRLERHAYNRGCLEYVWPSATRPRSAKKEARRT